MSELIYDALMLGRNKYVAREEYLAAKGDKAPVRFEAQEKNIYLTNITDDTTGIIHILMSEAGFAEIEVYCVDDFLIPEKNVFTSDDFTDGVYTMSFTVKADRLHDGRNFGRIIFRTPVCSCTVQIICHNQILAAHADAHVRKVTAAVYRDYLDLRLGNLFQREWQERALQTLSDINGSERGALFLSLYKANVLISCERYEEAKALIDFVSGQITKLPHNEWDLISYYMYISSLYEADDDITRSSLEKIQGFYDEHPSWMILWILFYMDPELSASPRRMLSAMEGEFLLRRCNSPVIYYEACEILRKDPDLMTELSAFALETLSFAARRDFLNIEVAIRVAELVWDADDALLASVNTGAAIRILKAAYDKFDSHLVLKSLCRLLIFEDRKDTLYHIYFENAIKAFLETKDIYNYFIYTADQSGYVYLPEAVLEYFVGRESTLGPYRDYFFACLLKRKERYGSYYGKYIGSMSRYAAENIEAAHTGSSLMVIYEDLMDNDLLSHDLYQRMCELLSVKEVHVRNELIVSVLVFHREFNEYQESYLEAGRAFVRIFTEDAAVLFKDTAGNLYYNIDHEIKEVADKAAYAEKCIRLSKINRYMLVGDNLDLLEQIKDPVEILKYMFANIGNGNLRSVYEQEVLKGMIMRFSSSSESREVSDHLLSFMQFDLDENTRGKLIEVMIDRKMYKEAFVEIEQNGFGGISPEYAASLAHMLAELSDYEPDPMMTELCTYAYKECAFDPVIFRYMCKNYDLDMDVLLSLYEKAHEEHMSDILICERIIRCMTESRKLSSNSREIFEKYYELGDDRELAESFMILLSDLWLYEKNEECTYIFAFIEKELEAQKAFPDRVVAAFILYEGTLSALESHTVRLIESKMRDLVRRSIMLEEFKYFAKYFQLPSVLTNTYIAEIFDTETDRESEEQVTRSNLFAGAPSISYELRQRGGTLKANEAMKEIFEGCYCHYFTLFYGESVIYTIGKGPSCVVTYNDIQIVHDGSRYSQIDNMLRLLNRHEADKLNDAIEEYYIRDALIERLF